MCVDVGLNLGCPFILLGVVYLLVTCCKLEQMSVVYGWKYPSLDKFTCNSWKIKLPNYVKNFVNHTVHDVLTTCQLLLPANMNSPGECVHVIYCDQQPLQSWLFWTQDRVAKFGCSIMGGCSIWTADSGDHCDIRQIFLWTSFYMNSSTLQRLTYCTMLSCTHNFGS